MQGLKELLLSEEKRLKKIQKIVDARLIDAPDGALRVTTSKNKVQFVRCVEGSIKSSYKLSYIKKEDFPLVKKLAQKSYDLRIKKLVDRRNKQLEKLVHEYADNEVENIYNKLHPIRKRLIEPVEPTYEQRVAQWKSIPYVGRAFKQGQPEIYSKRGERVRSKSEKILADMFYDMGIEYKYECPLNLKGYGIVYPDFTFLSKKTYKEIYWEHDGRMDDPEYAEKAIRNIAQYTRNGIIPGQRLIITYESQYYTLNTTVAEIMIREYLI